MSELLTKYDHVCERTCHSQTAIIDRVIKQHDKRVVIVFCQLHHAAVSIAAHDKMSDLRVRRDRLFEHRYRLRALTRPRKGDPKIVTVWDHEIVPVGK